MPKLSSNRTEEPVERARRQPQDPPPDAAPATMPAESFEIEILGSGRLWRSGQTAGFTDNASPQPASANVDAASVVTFVDGLSGQQKEDVLNSTLLAQLTANRKHDRERDTGAWYDASAACSNSGMGQPEGVSSGSASGRP